MCAKNFDHQPTTSLNSTNPSVLKKTPTAQKTLLSVRAENPAQIPAENTVLQSFPRFKTAVFKLTFMCAEILNTRATPPITNNVFKKFVVPVRQSFTRFQTAVLKQIFMCAENHVDCILLPLHPLPTMLLKICTVPPLTNRIFVNQVTQISNLLMTEIQKKTVMCAENTVIIKHCFT